MYDFEDGTKVERIPMTLDFITNTTNLPKTVSHHCALGKYFSQNFNDLITSDVTLKVGRKTFSIHQLVLHAWSPKFKKVLELQGTKHGLTDKTEGVLQMQLQDIEDFVKEFELVLFYFYSGSITLDRNNIWNVSSIADKFDIPELKEKCTEVLISFLPPIPSKCELFKYIEFCANRNMPEVVKHCRMKLALLYWLDIPSPFLTLEDFAASFLKIFDDCKTSDIILKTEKSKFYLHRLILYSRTEMFKQTLDEDENREIFTLDKDFYSGDEETLKKVLKYLYTDKIDIDFSIVWSIIKIAAKLGVDSLLMLCTQFIEKHAIFVPINEEIINCLKQTRLIELKNLYEIFYQILLAQFFLFSSSLLPSMNNDLLCQILESSDLLAYNEYSLFCILQPRLAELKVCDPAVFKKILNLVRFHQMSASQIKEVTELDIIPLDINDDRIQHALSYRCALWELAPISAQSKQGPRLYLDPPSPPLEISYNNKLSIPDPDFYSDKRFFSFNISENQTRGESLHREYIKQAPSIPMQTAEDMPYMTFGALYHILAELEFQTNALHITLHLDIDYSFKHILHSRTGLTNFIVTAAIIIYQNGQIVTSKLHKFSMRADILVHDNGTKDLKGVCTSSPIHIVTNLPSRSSSTGAKRDYQVKIFLFSREGKVQST